MKNCKHCGAPIDDILTTCPACGKSQDDAPEEKLPEEKAGKKRPEKGAIWLLCLIIAVAVAVVVILVVFLTRDGDAEPAPAETVATQAPADDTAPSDPPQDSAVPDDDSAAETPAADSADDTADDPADDPTFFEHVDADGNFVAHSYTKPGADITAEEAAAVVASCGALQLTNSNLNFYYWQQFYQFMTYYGSYLSALGIDLSQPLSTQMYDETHTWEDLFLRMAVSAFWQDCAVGNAAAEAGFAESGDVQERVDAARASLEEAAAAAEYETADAYLQSIYGPYVTTDDYLEYVRTSLANSEYLYSLFDSITYGEDEVGAYFDEHAEEFAAQGLEKDDTNMVNVRHILIQPVADEGAETDENGAPVLTDQNWADAEAKANDILAQWQAGEATEDSFAALSDEYNEDPGSASTGGLYEDVYPGQMVDTFNDWCFDAARQPGDTGVVRTSYGFHVMYFVGQCDHARWYTVAEQEYVADRQQALVQGMLDATAITVDYDKVVLAQNETM